MCVFLLLLLVVWICMCVEARQNSLIYFHLTELDLGKWPATAGIPCFHPAQTGVPGAHWGSWCTYWGSWCTLGFPVHILGFLVRTGVPGIYTGVPGAHRSYWCIHRGSWCTHWGSWCTLQIPRRLKSIYSSH